MADYTAQSSLLSPGRIGQAKWATALGKRCGPIMAAQVSAIYHTEAARRGLNPDLALAQACEECAWFTSGRWLHQRNPCGLGITSDDAIGVDFKTSENGIRAHLDHLCCYAYGADCPVDMFVTQDPRHTFHDGKPALSHLQDDTRKWATKPLYVSRILAIVNAVLASSQPPQPTGGGTMPRIALAAGHANTDGGNPFERVTTGKLTPAIARACQALGMDVRIVQVGDPSQDFKGGIWDVAGQVVQWSKSGWTPDIFLETHTQGVGDASVRGVFGIYPDWGADVDADARDRLIPDAVRRIASATGIPVWSRGVMSERQTGVGLGGSRLGILNKTAPLAATTTRLLIEYGAHSNPLDAQIHRTEAFYARAAAATAQACAAFLGHTPPVVAQETRPPRPEGWLNAGDADTFTWPGAEGIITERESVWFNPEKRDGRGAWYRLRWHHQRGYSSEEIA